MASNYTKQLLDLNIEKKEGMRTSFFLEKKRYKKFQKVCKKRGIAPSALIDSMIRDLLTELGEDESD